MVNIQKVDILKEDMEDVVYLVLEEVDIEDTLKEKKC